MIEEREKDVEHKCDQLVQSCGGSVVRFSQPRATKQTRGISDRRYRIHGVAFWFECKAPQGRLSRRQIEFMEAEYQCGAICACGGVEEVRAMIVACRGGLEALPLWPDVLGRSQVRAWIAKGVRG